MFSLNAVPAPLDTPSPPGRLLVVDGHAYAYRAYHAIPRLTAPDGAPTNAILGFIKMLAKLQDQLQAAYRVVVWDGGLAAERLASLPEYKAQRPEMPRELEQQLCEIHAYLEAAGVADLCQEGVEADDWIATLARRLQPAPTQTLIASSDKDFMQLVSDQVGLLNPNDKAGAVWTAAQVRAKTGVEPDQVVDWLSLIGDTVDNIPGVPGIGPKTAAKLLQRFGSNAALYAQLAQVEPESLRQALGASEGLVARNQKLIRLRDDLPCSLALESLAVKPGNAGRLASLYAKWGFHSLLKRFQSEPLPQASLL